MNNSNETSCSNIEKIKHKQERITVVEKSKNRYLSGLDAPLAINLKHWLKEHPTFQVVTTSIEEIDAMRYTQRKLKYFEKKRQEQKDSEKKLVSSKLEKVQKTLNSEDSKQLVLSKPKNAHVMNSNAVNNIAFPSHSKQNSVSQNSHGKHIIKKQQQTELTTHSNNDVRDHDNIRTKSKEGLQVSKKKINFNGLKLYCKLVNKSTSEFKVSTNYLFHTSFYSYSSMKCYFFSKIIACASLSISIS